MPESQTAPKVSRKKSLSIVWLIPIATLILSMFLAFQAWREQGTMIEIVFQQAEGVTANKTAVRYRDVDIGVVRSVRFSDDLTSVIVTAEIDSKVAEYLSVNSNFWIVSPQISLTGVSGLSTLLSGVFIEFDPGEKGEYQTRFNGLDEQPSIRSYVKGTSYLLEAEEFTSLVLGSRVFYRRLPVGEVTSFKLGEGGEYVQVRIFVESPYDQYVYKETNFWNSSGFKLDYNTKGLSLEMESVSSLLWGGIAFDTPDDIKALRLASSESVFPLFPSKQSVKEGGYSIEYTYELHFDSSIRGLEIGAPVEFKGIKVGRVTNINLVSDVSKVIVSIIIQPERLNDSIKLGFQDLNDLLSKLTQQEGMRAQLKTGSLVTGALFVDLALGVSKDSGDLIVTDNVVILPTAENEFSQITKVVSNVMARIDKIPLDQIGDDIAGLAASFRATLESLEQESFGEETGQLIKNLNAASEHLETLLVSSERTIRQAEASLAAIEPDTPLYEELIEMLRDVSEAAESIELLSDELSRNPQSLIYGNKNPEDE